MSAHLNAAPDMSPSMTEAVAVVMSELIAQAKPKALARAKAALMGRADMLETWDGCRLPAGVVSIYEWRQARASVEQRRERAELAAAIRSVLASI